jgi:hypothetical protein
MKCSTSGGRFPHDGGMRKSAFGFAGVLIAILVANAPLRAETVTFPDEQPVFKIEVPDGWAAKSESEGTLYLRPTSGNTGHFFAFIELPAAEIPDESAAKKYVESRRATDLDKLGADEKGRSLWPVNEETLPNSLKGWSADDDVLMKIKPGDLPQMKAYSAIVFSPDGKKYFLMLAFGRSGDAMANKDFLKKSIAVTK